MIIGTLRVRLHLAEATSLKGKRFILKGLKERLRSKFNIAVSEIGEKDLWQTAELAIAAVGDEKRGINAALDQVLNFISTTNHVAVTENQLEFF